MNKFLNRSVLPILVMTFAPFIVFFLYRSAIIHNGCLRCVSIWEVIQSMSNFSSGALYSILGFTGLQYILMFNNDYRPKIKGSITPDGNQPVYYNNGFDAFIRTHLILLPAHILKVIDLTWIYDHFEELLATLNLLGIVLSLFWYLKALYYPNKFDVRKPTNSIWDFYCGLELHPRIGSVQIKQLINCRIGMLGWSVIIIGAFLKNPSVPLSINVILQLVYIGKFFWWEGGYFKTMDIMHDSFGFYLCWGILCWLPCVYTLSTMYMVNNISNLAGYSYIYSIICGLLSIYMNYEADWQKQFARDTKGQCEIWNQPAKFINTSYKTNDGKTRQTILLVSGWWGVARHFHYLPELMTAFSWTAVAGNNSLIPWIYIISLTILLIHRVERDNKRCSKKYGPAWERYTELVPYKIIPGIY